MTDNALTTLLVALAARTGRRLDVLDARPDHLQVRISGKTPAETIALSGPEVFALCDVLASGATRIGREGDYRGLFTTAFYWQCFRPVKAKTLLITADVLGRGSRLVSVKLVLATPEFSNGPCAEANVTIYARPSRGRRQVADMMDRDAGFDE